MKTFNNFKSFVKQMKQHEYILLVMWIALMVTMFVPSVSAETYLLHKQNTDLNFSITSNFASSCNLTTINTPNGVIAIGQNVLGSGTFSYSILGGNYSSLGTYCHNIVCTDGTDKTSGQECREVTSDGLNGKFGFTILILLLSLGVIVLGLWKQDGIVTILGSFGLYFIGLNILFYGLDGFKDPIYTWAFGLITLGIAFYVSIRSAYELIID